MGSLAHFHLPAMIERYGLQHFVETGTGSGDSLALAAKAGFKTLHSVELEPSLAAAARARFGADKRVRIWEGESAEALRAIFEVLPQDEPALFWLDAHFIGADYGLAAYDADANIGRRLPLERELEAILTCRLEVQRDVILCDDARVYAPGPYGAGDLPPDFPGLRGAKRSLAFVRRLLGQTHGIVTDYADQGYVMVCPRMTYEQVNLG